MGFFQKNTATIALFILSPIVILAALVMGGWLETKYGLVAKYQPFSSDRIAAKSQPYSPRFNSQTSLEEIVAFVEASVAVPADQQPTVAIITDPAALLTLDPQLCAGIQQNDVLVSYSNVVVIVSRAQSRILTVLPVVRNQPAAVEAGTSVEEN